jgi:hypothetical protein
MRRPPLVSLLGLAVAVLGLALDAAVHLSAAPHHHQMGFSPEEHGAHLVVLIGMLLILGGIVIDGARGLASRRAPRQPTTTESTHRSSTHATR